ncbi:lysylphosphatidylglycerol synthase domain-containing protein [Litorihabitans aurantiacus]|uniref:lysylphosphatidylglycerol synthase domain-containing protein n=1 Tax=Litorihabitans aurantiacus TaxID=1930061 RepID=UPI0024E17A1F|nr:lysylphosphatidylglycerol synthase domain-containing protein [Litorihabitans aurantiacus]
MIAIAAAQVLVSVGLLVALGAAWGWGPFADALTSLPWWALLGGALLGGLGVVLQGLRARVVARHHGIPLTTRSAVARCWQSAFLNGVLPGGVGGDLVRALDDSSDHEAPAARQALTSSVRAVAAERLVGTTIVFAAAGVVLLPLAPLVAVAALAVALAAAVLSRRWLRGLGGREVARITALSLLGWATFVAMFVLAAIAVAPRFPPAELPGLAAVALGGMSVPLGVGGWGPREAAAGWVFETSGHPASLGLAVSIAYGLLALVSTVPGAVVLAVRTWPRLRAVRAARERRARA